MNIVSKKEYDIYGNLILDILINTFEVDIGSEVYETYKNMLSYKVGESKDTVIFTSGHCNTYKYDERNNMISYEHIYYSDSYYKYVEEHIYVYSDDGRVLEDIWFVEDVPLINTTESLQDNIHVMHYMYIYDEHNNLVEEQRKDYYLPLGTAKKPLEIKYDAQNSYLQYENIYNKKRELIQIFDKKEHKLIADLTYISGRLEKKLFYYGRSTYFIKYIYSDDELVKEEFYSKCGILLKIVEYVNIHGRMCKKVLSPANDNYKWYISHLYLDGSCEVVIIEETLTVKLLDSIYNYIIKHKDIILSNLKILGRRYYADDIDDSWFSIYFEFTDNLDISTYAEEINAFMDKKLDEDGIRTTWM